MSALDLLRPLYLERGDAVIEARGAGGAPLTLFVRGGELFLDRSEPRAEGVTDLLADPAIRARPAADATLRERMGELAGDLASRRAVKLERPPGAVELVGPLPTVSLLLALAARDRDPNRLQKRLGGGAARYAQAKDSPALTQLPGLDPDLGQVLMALEQVRSVDQLLPAVPMDRLEALRCLACLHAVGLVERDDPPAARGARMTVPARTVTRFEATIAASLASMPVDLDAAAHRAAIGELWQSLGELDHYRLLEIDAGADADAVHAAFGRVARLVHPQHAERLGFQSNDAPLQVLFERAVEAYLTLSDPGRRVAYNQLIGTRVAVEVDDAQRSDEKRRMAQDHYRHATHALANQEISVAVDLLREAVRLDPQPEYLALLGRAMTKNPGWHRHARASLRRAIDLRPEEASYRADLGRVLEKMLDHEGAIEQYRRALAIDPHQIDAHKALERLGAVSGPESSGVRKLMSGFFGRNAEE